MAEQAQVKQLRRLSGSGEIYALTGEAMHEALFDDLRKAKSDIVVATADLKLAQTGPNEHIIDVFEAMPKIDIRILCSRTTTPFRKTLAESRLLDRTTFQIRQCERNHSKAFMIDGRTVYVGSANLTGKGVGPMASEHSRNNEIMIRMDGSRAVSLIRFVLDASFEPFWSGKDCDRCRRRKRELCPGLLNKFQILDRYGVDDKPR